MAKDIDRDRKDDTGKYLVRNPNEVFMPQDEESERCGDETNSILCAVLSRVNTSINEINMTQVNCPTWNQFIKHKERQGRILPCVHLRGQLMNNRAK